tara:strand:- start:6341 stop:7318 length:978 start_codon:yes stop_codon:yes gene_type:complete
MTTIKVAGLDVWTPEVRAAVLANIPAEFEIAFADTYDPTEQAALAADADIILTGWAEVTAEMIAAAPRLKMIQKWGIGLERIDLEACEAAGIAVAITAGGNASVVAEHAIMLMLSVLRRLSMVDQAAREGRWLFDKMRGICMKLSGKTVGLVGFGHIGQSVARKLMGFEVDVIYSDLARRDAEVERRCNARYVSFEELIAQSDIVSLHIPGGAENEKLINADVIKRMKERSVLINVSRGDIVDEDALYDALVSGHLMGAGLDVFDPEPPQPGVGLLTLEQVVITPHTAGSVLDNVPNVARHAFGNMQKFLSNQPFTPADEVLPRP